MRAIRGGDILIIDGDAAWTATAVAAFESNGHSVSTRASLYDGRVAIERDLYDVIICAAILPDGSGLKLCEFVKNNPDLPQLSRCSFALITSGLGTGAPPDIAQFETERSVVKSVIEPRSLFGLRRKAEMEASARAATTNEPAPVRPLFSTETSPPDDVIFRSVSPVDLVLRVQILLRMRRYLEEIFNAISGLIAVAEGVEEQDKRAEGHCKRLALMVLELGVAMGCDDWQLTALERAAYLHDIGKVAIPGAIFSKSEALTPREMEVMQSHCLHGERLCASVAALKPVLPIIRHHHERVNGTGYPDGLHGADIPILAQILTIPDIYDALRMWRPYRAPMTQAQAVAVLTQEVTAGLWNRTIFEKFMSHVLPGLDARLDSYGLLWPAS